MDKLEERLAEIEKKPVSSRAAAEGLGFKFGIRQVSRG